MKNFIRMFFEGIVAGQVNKLAVEQRVRFENYTQKLNSMELNFAQRSEILLSKYSSIQNKIADMERNLLSALNTSGELGRRELLRLGRELDFVKQHIVAPLETGVAMTWLVDELIIYVNSDDEGCPTNFISGGTYEEENMDVVLSFLNPDGIMLDIGANLGVFSLRAGSRLRNTVGKIFSFEPHPSVCALFKRSVFHNGLSDRIEVYNCALSDMAGQSTFYYPAKHVGGGGQSSGGQDSIPINVELKKLDDLLPSESIDVAKIDVEGNEFTVLSGMKQVVARSPNLAIVFEKLQAHSNIDSQLIDYFNEFGMSLYRITGQSILQPATEDDFRSYGGYYVAAKASRINNELDRRFYDISCSQLQFPATANAQGGEEQSSHIEAGRILFHGPYFHLPRGRYAVKYFGKKTGAIHITVAERFGYSMFETTIEEEVDNFIFEAPYDLYKFEIVARAGENGAALAMKGLRIQRL